MARPADAQERSEADVAKTEKVARALEAQVAEILANMAEVVNKDVPAGDREVLRKRLLPLVEESFTARQKWQAAQLADLRRRLGEIERAIEQREKNKDAIIRSRLDELLSSPPTANANSQTRPRAHSDGLDANHQPSQMQADRAQASEAERIYYPELDETAERPRRAGNRTGRPASEEFDIDTRQQLAELDLQAAEGDVEAAREALSIAQALHSEGRTARSSLLSAEKDFSRAEVEVKRAKAKLQGVARQRTELESAAEAAFAEAKAKEQQAVNSVRIAQAGHEAAVAELDKTKADVETAKAFLNHAEKESARLEKLAEANAVDAGTLAQHQEKVTAGKAALIDANAAVIKADAKVRECAAAANSANSALYVARVHLRAATLRRDRLKVRAATDKGEATTAPTNKDGDPKSGSEAQTK